MRFGRKLLTSMGCAVVLTAAIAVPAFAEEGVTTMATSAPLNMREAANINSQVITTIPQGTSVQVFGMTYDGWYDVSYNGQRGNCWYQYLDFEGTGDGTVHDGHVTDMYATAPLNVRAQPNTSAQILGSLAEGQYVAILSKHDGWFKVSFNGQEAYCYGQYLGFGQTGASCQATTSDQGTSGSVMNDMTAAYPLNVRSAPGTDASILGSYKVGEMVKVIGAEGDWYKVQFNNQVGYVYSAYLQ